LIVPIYKTDEEKSSVLDTARKLKAELAKAIFASRSMSVKAPARWKFNDGNEGRSSRVELGPKDVAKQAAVLARRDRPGGKARVSAPLADLPLLSSDC